MTFEWDGFDRLSKQSYPDTSFEEYTFDENSKVLVRVTRNGDSVTTIYDPLNRVETQEPTGLALRTLTFDLAGRLTKMSTPVVGGDPTTGDYEFSFDTAGRLVQQTTPASQSIDYELDENGNRTKLTWPDTYFAQYFFDELNRLTDIKLNGSTDAAAHFAYDALSRRIGLDYGNDCTSSYSYWTNDDMSLLAHNFVGSSVSFAFGYNAVHQVTNQLVSDDTFVWNPLASNLTVYGPANNLNEYPDVMEPFEYDANGCLTSNGVNAYSYDALTTTLILPSVFDSSAAHALWGSS